MAGLFGESDADENAVVPERDDEESGYRDPMTGRVWIVMALNSGTTTSFTLSHKGPRQISKREKNETKWGDKMMEESSTPLLAIMGR